MCISVLPWLKVCRSQDEQSDEFSGRRRFLFSNIKLKNMNIDTTLWTIRCYDGFWARNGSPALIYLNTRMDRLEGRKERKKEKIFSLVLVSERDRKTNMKKKEKNARVA